MKERYCKFKSITLHKGFVESEAWKVLTKSQIDVFIYIWSCLQWGKVKKNWEHECPKSPNNLVGKDTRFKSHPKELDRINDNQSK